MNSTALAAGAAALIPAFLAAHSLPWRAPRPVSRVRWLMGTACEITAHGPRAAQAVDAAFAEIERWDQILSLYKPESELSRLNRQASQSPFRCSKELWEAVVASLKYARLSGGAFDPTVLPLLKASPRALPLVGFGKVAADPTNRSVRFKIRGMGLDPGGIGKGIALDHAAGVLRRRGVGSALINFGGQLYALGAPPGESAWTVRVPGLASPLRVCDASVSTSGNEERPGHIVSPFTGRRIADKRRATVVARSAAAADAWSTALFVLDGRAPASFDGSLHYFKEKSR